MTDDEICQRLADAIRYDIAESQYHAALTWGQRLRNSIFGKRGPAVRVTSVDSYLHVDVGELHITVPDGVAGARVTHGTSLIVDHRSSASRAKSELATAVRELAAHYRLPVGVDIKRAAAIAAVQSLTR